MQTTQALISRPLGASTSGYQKLNALGASRSAIMTQRQKNFATQSYPQLLMPKDKRCLQVKRLMGECPSFFEHFSFFISQVSGTSKQWIKALHRKQDYKRNFISTNLLLPPLLNGETASFCGLSCYRKFNCSSQKLSKLVRGLFKIVQVLMDPS